jgi:hypothetical protein
MTTNTMDRDAALLLSTTGATSSIADYLDRIVPSLHEQAIAMQLRQLSEAIRAETKHLSDLAWQELRIIAENLDRGDQDSEPRSGGDGRRPGVANDDLRAVYDQRAVKLRDEVEWYTGKTSKKRGICFHHTAVKGGFGTRKDRVDYWKRVTITSAPSVPLSNKQSVLTAWTVPPPADRLGEGDEAVARWARAMALADRFRGYVYDEGSNGGVPYHAVSCTNSVLVLNLPFDWWTWHGNAANEDYLGFAWDGHSAHDTFDREQLLAQIRHVIEVGRSEGHFTDELKFTGHCCFSNKSIDPGKDLVEFLVEIADRCGATIDLDYKYDDVYTSFADVLGG